MDLVMILPRRSIKSLYSIALCEGEGVGTAYEYFAKRLIINPWLGNLARPRRVLIAGLPEKYGSGLDLLLLAQDIGASDAIVIDDRETALAKCRRGVEAALVLGELRNLNIEYVSVTDLAALDAAIGVVDLCLASEVMQRLEPAAREEYLKRLLVLAPAFASFAPNADNSKHRTLSGLSGVSVADLKLLTESRAVLEKCDYLDMPPWPPGLTQSNAQRDRMAHGKFDAVAMTMLEQYARLEKFCPQKWRRTFCHIVYAFIKRLGSKPAKV